ncbi:MAG: hypothetical protein ACXADH_03210, partial [Candidatus Kariarchaeaceae archaeon]
TDSGTTIDILVIDHAGRSQTITIDVIEDSIAPSIGTLNLLLTTDTDTVGNGITPDTGYYDDDSVEVTISGTPTESGSGVSTTPYSYKYDGGTYGTNVSGGATITSVPQGNNSLWVRVRDKVGNAQEFELNWVIVDLTNPTGYTSTIYETANDLYLYEDGSGTLIYFNGGQDNLEFDIEVTAGTETNFWKVRFPAAFGESQEEDSIASYQRNTDYDIDSTDSGTTIDVLVIDSAGRTQTITITVTEDSNAPTIGSLNLALTTDTDDGGDGVAPDTGYYDDDSVDVTFSGSVSEVGSGLPASPYSYKYNGGTYGSWVSGGTSVASVPEGSQTIYVQVRDNVGKSAVGLSRWLYLNNCRDK